VSQHTTAAELASAAAEAIRGLNHASMSAPRAELEYPADAYEVMGALSAMAQRLPQAIEQTQRFMDRLHDAGRLRHDSGAPALLAGDLIALRVATDDAVTMAGMLARALADVHSDLSAIAYNESGGEAS
jgi:hypothetical protein